MRYCTLAVVAIVFLASALGRADDWPWTFLPDAERARPALAHRLPSAASVDAFSPAEHGISFVNYAIWAGSRYPEFVQLPHCTGMSLLARQVFLHAVFKPERDAISAERMEKRLRKIFTRDARARPGDLPRIVLPGYANLFELSKEASMEEAIKNVLGDAIFDALRAEWNWSLTDVLNRTRKTASNASLDANFDIASGRPVIFYLTNGTEQAHAVLAYAYSRDYETGDVEYSIYDSNHPGKTQKMTYKPSLGKMVYSQFSEPRDMFILYPYSE